MLLECIYSGMKISLVNILLNCTYLNPSDWQQLFGLWTCFLFSLLEKNKATVQVVELMSSLCNFFWPSSWNDVPELYIFMLYLFPLLALLTSAVNYIQSNTYIHTEYFKLERTMSSFYLGLPNLTPTPS